jgi:NADPH-dependent glutamate synthase beta subunit-like oxidoreductase
MQAEGVIFRPNTHIGVDMPAQQLLDRYDAVVLWQRQQNKFSKTRRKNARNSR